MAIDAAQGPPEGGDVRDASARSGNYYRLPLAEDTGGRSTLMRVEPSDGGQVLLHLHDCQDERAFGVRLGYALPDHRPGQQPRHTFTLPATDEPGLTPQERVLAWLGRFLVETAFGSDQGEIYPWPFEGVIPNDEWLLHLTVLCSTYERLGPARRSGVMDDQRVRAAVDQVAAAAEPHALAAESWLAQVRRLAPEARARWAAEKRERTVQHVLDELDVHSEEDLGARPNPALPRLGPSNGS